MYDAPTATTPTASVPTARRAGFSLIELLIVIVVMGIILGIGLPLFFSARERARERAAESFATNVYKVAYSYVATDPSLALTPEPDCVAGYVAGEFSVDSGAGLVKACEVDVDSDGTPLVTVVSYNDVTISVP